MRGDGLAPVRERSAFEAADRIARPAAAPLDAENLTTVGARDIAAREPRERPAHRLLGAAQVKQVLFSLVRVFQFTVRHLVIAKVRGQFSRWTGRITAPGTDFRRARLEVVIDAASLDTGVADRDAHLRSADFFDVERHPEITFTSTDVARTASDRLRLTGDLTMKGVTREVVLDVEELGTAKDPWGIERAAFSATTAVDRRAFGLTWNQVLETGGVMVGDRIDISIEIEAVRQAATKVA
jgi:polyisoprenoid-binding protein YceI